MFQYILQTVGIEYMTSTEKEKENRAACKRKLISSEEHVILAGETQML